MQVADNRILKALNEALEGEMNSIQQYFIHAEMCANWGYKKLAAEIRNTSIQEMRHAEKYIERILFFESVPHIEPGSKLNIGKDVEEQLTNDLDLETGGIANMNGWIKLCSDAGDDATRELFSRILLDEEKHVEWLETRLWIIKELGIGTFLAQQI